jgi:hypothetical protein
MTHDISPSVDSMDSDSDSDGVVSPSLSLNDVLPVSEILNTSEISSVEQLYQGFEIVDYIWLEYIMKLYGHFVCIEPVYIHIDVSNNKQLLSIMNYNGNFTSIQDFNINLNNCIYNDKQFIILFLSIKSTNVCTNCIGCDECFATSYHSNVLIIDIQNKLVERYEPHGDITCLHPNQDINVQYNIIIHQLLVSFWSSLDYTFDYNPLSSTQHQLQKYNHINDIGYCTIFSGWYAMLRLKFSHLSQQEFNMRLSNKLGEYEMISYIRRYAKVIVDRAQEIAQELNIPFHSMQDFNKKLVSLKLFPTLFNLLTNNNIDIDIELQQMSFADSFTPESYYLPDSPFESY